MNILYYDEKQLWSPKLNDLQEEYNTTETISINQAQIGQGKQMTLFVAPFDSPADKHQLQIGEE
jgi:hypothetical protein